jgi:atypical dual specificity phosphatase
VHGRPNPIDWILPDQLAACIHPGYAPTGLDDLHRNGISVVINLHEHRHSPERLKQLGMRELHLPVADFTPPTQEQLDAGVAAIDAALNDGERVGVHCAAGLGRTGTLVAAYLVHAHRLDPPAAIQHVRALRPGAIETPEQEAAIATFATRNRSSGT